MARDDMDMQISLQLARIGHEVTRAMELHPPMNSAHEAYAVILEEVEEFWEDVKENPEKLSVQEQLKRTSHMRTELIHIAAMCIRATIDCNLIGAKR
jgi:hypothetical protein